MAKKTCLFSPERQLAFQASQTHNFVPKNAKMTDTSAEEKVNENVTLTQIVSSEVRSEHAGTKNHYKYI